MWLQFFAGLRAGEAQALKWQNVDFERGRLLVAGTFVRKEDRFKESPKGGAQHWVPMPKELQDHLLARRMKATSEYVAGEDGGFLGYDGYYKALAAACKKLGITSIGTHGLRHSTSEFYLSNGASAYDVNVLFDHSDMKVTEGYMHDRGSRLENVAKVIRLFPDKEIYDVVSQEFPKSDFSKYEATDVVENTVAK